MKVCSTSLIIREMHIKIKRYYFTPTRIAKKKKKTDNNEC